MAEIALQDDVRSAFDASAKKLERLCRPALEEDASAPLALKCLRAEWWFLREQVRQVDTALRSKSYTKLPRTTGQTGKTEPRVYRALAETLNCLIASPMGIQALGKMLTTSAVLELFSPARLGTTLTTVELWAVPMVVKLLLVVRIAELLPAGDRSESADGEEVCAFEVRSAISCLHALAGLRWRVIVESISAVHQILAQDPHGTYSKMEPESRELYQGAVAQIASEADAAEEDVARCAVALASEAAKNAALPARCDAGYYLIGEGRKELRERGGFRASVGTRGEEWMLAHPNAVYIGGIATLTVLFTWALIKFAGPLPALWTAFLVIPASVPAVALVNMLINMSAPRRRLPRLDLSRGIPDDHRTCVVIPTLLLSRAAVDRLLETIEVRYLANRCGPNLVLALLTDFPDCVDAAPKNGALLDVCVRGIRRLNERYAADGFAPFYLFHRNPEWNESQGRWMGRERKRGKLEDFNRYLLHSGDAFQVKAGVLGALGEIKHVITLDTDTQLPRDAAWRLIATLAHPLQQPVMDGAANRLAQGYPILQPALKTAMQVATASWFTGIFAGQTGVDAYTGASADVYHDLYGSASFVGKGIYDVRAMHALLDGRFADNTLLSHDLIEGEYARAGLVADVDMVEDYPQTYEVWTKRTHRWIRGDWQIIQWLFGRVPSATGPVNNPLGLASRWKIADNLRRSVVDLNLLFLLVAAWWLLAPDVASRLSAAVLLILAWPAFLDLTGFVISPWTVSGWRGELRERVLALARSLGEACVHLIFLPYQAMITGDAIVRTLMRRFVTHRNLLEWETMAQVEAAADGGVSWTNVLFLGAVTLAVSLGSSRYRPMSRLAAALAILWAASPLVARALRQPLRRAINNHPRENEFLRDISLRTWRYFVDFSIPRTHWLVPDNVQENPEVIAQRASPTNIGLQLASTVAASDFGYLTRQELVDHLDNILLTLERLDRYRGHFFNWYETDTMAPMAPRYVSTVDSGNLAASLIAVKQACGEIKRHPVIAANLLEGMRDHCIRLRRSIPVVLGPYRIVRTLHALIGLAEERPANLFQWNKTLSEIAVRVDQLNAFCEEPGAGQANSATSRKAEDFDYWRRALAKRAQSALASLHHLAPWLNETYASLWNRYGSDARYEELLVGLTRVPQVDQLYSLYDSTEAALARILTEAPVQGSDNGLWIAEEPSENMLLTQLKQEIRTARLSAKLLVDGLTRNETIAAQFAHSMDFAFLFDADRDLMRIGYNTQKGQLDNSYYDLLASEARTAVFFAVAKGDVPRRTWFQLGRKPASFQGHHTLVSWSGTMFEYLMPAIFMKTFSTSLLGKTLYGVVRAQQAYGRQKNVPWGISESSCYSQEPDSQYGYRAFGIPGVSLSAESPDKLVVAPYASMLALMVDRRHATDNLRRMAAQGWTGRYGFFEAVDFQPQEKRALTKGAVVRSFMAHHQGMGFLALCNVLLGNPMQTRFHADPMVAAAELLLQERVPTAFGDTDVP